MENRANLLAMSGTVVRSFVLTAALFLLGSTGISAQINLQPVDETRVIFPGDWGVNGSAGVAYSTKLGHFFSLDKSNNGTLGAAGTTIITFTPYEDLVADLELPSHTAEANAFAFDDSAERLLLLDRDLSGITQVKIGDNGVLDSATPTHFDIDDVGLHSASGMAVDVASLGLFILDSADSRLVRIELVADLSQASFTKIALSAELDPMNLRGLALNPANFHLYLIHPARQLLYEVNQSGELLAIYDLSTLQLKDPRSIVFAPSSDQTDLPQTRHLFIADGGPQAALASQHTFPFDLYLSVLGTDNPTTPRPLPASRIIEVKLDVEPAARAASALLVPLTLVQTLDLSVMDPPSPDPSGLDYIEAINAFLIVDGEVEEMVNGAPPPYWEGGNIFVVAVPNGIVIEPTLLFTGTTVNPITRNISLKKGDGFSKEPVAVAYNPANGHIFISSDDQRMVFQVDPGSNGRVDHTDQIVTKFSTNLFPPLTHYPDDTDTDPEGIDYDPVTGRLIIADGTHSEVYIVDPGPNGIFDGVSPTGDDQLTYFDTKDTFGLQDPESVFVKSDGNYLFASNHTENRLYETDANGNLVKLYDITVANADNPAGIVMAPSSTNPGELSIYVADRMDDNNVATGEMSPNDGRIYEFALAQTQGSSSMLFVGSASGGTAGNIKFADEDVLVYSGGVWDIYFDGSDVLPTSADVDAFTILADDSILLGFNADVTISGFGLVKEFDIVRFVPTSIGTNTAGTFYSYFVGTSAELTVAAEDIDAFAILADGSYVVSTAGNPTVTGVSPIPKDEDLLVYSPSSNTWAYYVDGSDVGLADAASEDVNGLWIDSNGDLYLTTMGLFTVNGLSGDADDIFICEPGTLGANTTCTYRAYWDGGANGFAGEVIDSLFIIPEGQQASSAMMQALRASEHAGEGDDPDADLDEGPDNVEELEQEHRLFLPLAID